MPEYPDLELYRHALSGRVVGQPIEHVRVASPFVLRTVEPPLDVVEGRQITGIERIGKHLVFALDGDDHLHLVIHLMIAGRFRWQKRGAALPRRTGLAAFDFATGSLLLVEAAKKQRAALHLVSGEGSLDIFDRGGIEPFDAEPDDFRAALTRENHTLKRALTDPRLVSGIGNAYSDEILHRARLSPMQQTRNLSADDFNRLYRATLEVLARFRDLLITQTGAGFPTKVTAFRPEMAVHGKYDQACPDCGTPVQRIVYAENECNYCPTCQTSGRLLADRSLSRLLKKDWPRTLDELEERRSRST
jgi:formamidopyrimidine-DNA glycosylase